MTRYQPWFVRFAWTIGLLAVLGQRLAITGPGGVQLLVSALIVGIFLLVALATPVVRLSLPSLLVWSGLGASACITYFLGGGDAWSMSSFSYFSLILLLVLYFSATLVTAPVAPGDAHRTSAGRALFHGAFTAVTIGAALVVVQSVVQASGGGFVDVFRSIDPSFLMADFNSYYSTQFVAGGAAGEFKPNGMIFVEPSWASLYSGIALVYLLTRVFADTSRANDRLVWRIALIVLFATALALSASSSGLFVMAFGLVPLAFQLRRNLPVLAGLLALGVLALLAGLFDQVIEKASEGFEGQTSTALRLTLPYEYFTPFWLEHPWFGYGAGVASDISLTTNILGLQVATTLKALIEYGLVGALMIFGLVLLAAIRSTAPLPLLACVLAAWLLPSESLVNPIFVVLMGFAFPDWKSRVAFSPTVQPVARARRHPAPHPVPVV